MHFVHGWLGSYVVKVGWGRAGCGIVHGEGASVAAGWRVGGVGHAEGASVNGWSLGALNAAAILNLRNRRSCQGNQNFYKVPHEHDA
jgi:hypothetical protein